MDPAGALVTDEPLSSDVIAGIFLAGKAYHGYFQGDIPECDRPWVLHTASLYTVIDIAEELCDLEAPPTRWLPRIPQERIVFALDLKPPESQSGGGGTSGNMSSSSGRGAGRKAVGEGVVCIKTRTLAHSLAASGGVSCLLAMLEAARGSRELLQLLCTLRHVLWADMRCLYQMDVLGGYAIVGRIMQAKAAMITREVIREVLRLTGLGCVPNLAIVANPQVIAHHVHPSESWLNACGGRSGIVSAMHVFLTMAYPQAAAHLVADFRLWKDARGDMMCDAYSGLQVSDSVLVCRCIGSTRCLCVAVSGRPSDRTNACLA